MEIFSPPLPTFERFKAMPAFLEGKSATAVSDMSRQINIFHSQAGAGNSIFIELYCVSSSILFGAMRIICMFCGSFAESEIPGWQVDHG